MGFLSHTDDRSARKNPLYEHDTDLLEGGEFRNSTDVAVAPSKEGMLERANNYYKSMSRIQKVGLFGVGGLVLGVIGIFTIGPVVGQAALDGSSMNFKSITLSEPKDVQEGTTMKVSAVAVIGNDFFLGAGLSEFGVDISYKGEVMGTMILPALDIGGSTETEVALDDLDFTVSNVDLFSQMNDDLVKGESVDWKIEGKTSMVAKMGSTPATPSFEGLSLSKITPIKGLGGLGDPDKLIITSVDLPSNYESGSIKGLTVNIKSVLKNPSIVSLPLGDVKFSMSYDGVAIGVVETKNMVLVQGDNLIDLTGYMAIPDLELASKFFSMYMAGETIPVVVKGLPMENPAAAWIDTLVQSLELHPNLVGLSGYSVVEKMDMTRMSVSFTESATDVATEALIFAAYEIPYAFPLDIQTLSMDLSLSYNDKVFGTLSATNLVPKIPCGYPKVATKLPRNTAVGQMNLTLPLTTLKVTNQGAFETFTKALISSTTPVKITTAGTSSAMTKSNLGQFVIGGLAIKADATIYPMQNFKSPNNILLSNVDIKQANTADELSLTLNVGIQNPSSLVGNLGQTTLDVYWDHAAGKDMLLCNKLTGGACLTPTSAFPSWGVNIQKWSFPAGLTKIGRAIVKSLALTQARSPAITSAIYPPSCPSSSTNGGASYVAPAYPDYSQAKAGSNVFTLTDFIFEKSSGEVGAAFLSTYVQGTAMALVLRGDRGSSSFASTLPLLKESLKAMDSATLLPGLSDANFLMKSVKIGDLTGILDFINGPYVTSVVTINNPFSAAMTVTNVLFNVYTAKDNKYVGYTSEAAKDQAVSFTIPSKAVGFTTPSLKVRTALTNEGAISALSGAIVLEGTMKVKIGDKFETTLTFHQSGVASSVF